MISKIPFLMLICGTLAACDGGMHSRHYDYLDRNNRPYSPPPATMTPFQNAAAMSNADVTSMISRNAAQIDAYIQYRMDGYGGALPDATSQDIAATALWLTTGDVSGTAFQERFATDPDLMRAALFVINRSLASCGASGNAATAAQCFVGWRTDKADLFQAATREIQNNAQAVNLEAADFESPDGARLKFTLNEAGKITHITLSNAESDINLERIESSGTFSGLTADNNLGILTYISTARAQNYGLKYADFGTYKFQTQGPFDKSTTTKTMPFAGGYAEQRVDPTRMDTAATFVGYADAVVTSTKGGAPRTQTLGGSANLHFDPTDGTHRLHAAFNDWYDVVAVQTGDNTKVAFMNAPDELADDMRLDLAADTTGNMTTDNARLNVTFYGQNPDTGFASEATGLLHYTDCPGGVCDETVGRLQLDMAFGGYRITPRP